MVTPLAPIDKLHSLGSGYVLVIYAQADNTLNAKLQVFVGDSTYCSGEKQFATFDFSGILYQMDMDGNGSNVIAVKNGDYIRKMAEYTETGKTEDEPLDYDGLETGPDTSCPKWPSGGGFWHAIGNFFSNVFGNHGNDSNNNNNSGSTVWITLGYDGFPTTSEIDSGNGGGGGNSGGNNGGHFYNEMEPGFFDAWEYQAEMILYVKDVREELTNYFNIADPDTRDFLISEVINSNCTNFGEDGSVVVVDDLQECLTNQILDWLSVQTELSSAQNNWIRNNPEQLGDIIDFLKANQFDDASRTSLKAYIDMILLSPNLQLSNQQVITIFNQYLDEDITNLDFPTYCGIDSYLYGTEYPDWSSIKKQLWSYYSNISSGLHLTLDVVGLVPVFGEVADLTNGVLYTIEGDGINATLSYASTIPIAGWFSTGAKFAIKIVPIGGVKMALVWAFRTGTNIIEFGAKSSLRKVIGLAVGDARQAHHLIPWATRYQQIVQRAASSINNTFHIDELANGIAVEAWRNQPNHPAYDTAILAVFGKIKDHLAGTGGLITNVNPDLVAIELRKFQNYLRDLITANPTVHLNDLPINYTP